MVDRPIARMDGLASTTVDDELVIYDSERAAAHCLTAEGRRRVPALRRDAHSGADRARAWRAGRLDGGGAARGRRVAGRGRSRAAGCVPPAGAQARSLAGGA